MERSFFMTNRNVSGRLIDGYRRGSKWSHSLLRSRTIWRFRVSKMSNAEIFFLDTNAASEFGRGRNLRLMELMHRHRPKLRLSSIVWSELEYGAYKKAHEPVFRERLIRLREHIPLVDIFDEHAARWAGKVRAHLELLKPNAQPIGPMDALIAGHALLRNAVVVTHNVREFARVPGLRVVDWESVQ